MGKYSHSMKCLLTKHHGHDVSKDVFLTKFILQAQMNVLADRVWSPGRMFDAPDLYICV